MSDLALMLRLQACVTAFLAELSRDRLVALAEGRVRLAITDRADGRAVDPEPGPARAPFVAEPLPAAAPGPSSRSRAARAATIDAAGLATRLRACETSDEGAELLATLNLTTPDVRSLAKAFNVPYKNKPETTRRILTLALANRNKHAALRQG